MSYHPFKKAKPVFIKGKSHVRNYMASFDTELPKNKKLRIRITASSLYRMFYNEKLLSYGPMRSAHGFFMVDEIQVQTVHEIKKLHIEVLSYHVDTFYIPFHDPFVVVEVYDGDTVIRSTPTNFIGYTTKEHITKTGKFSYQRAFQEAYRMKEDPIKYDERNELETEELELICDDIQYRERKLSYYQNDPLSFSILEKGHVTKNQKKMGPDRFLVNPVIGAYQNDELEVRPFDDVICLDCKKTEDTSPILKDKDYLLFHYPVSKTGFVTLDLNVYREAKVYVTFSEVDFVHESGTHDIDFLRNDTYNLVYYEFQAGHYHVISFEAYTAKYCKVLVLDGEVEVEKLQLIPYENTDTRKLYFHCSDEKLNAIIEGARNTLAQNAVDVLTDCPSRERGGWLCDSRFSAIAEKLFTGENKVEENFLLSYSDYDGRLDLPKGVIPMCYPGDVLEQTYLPNWMLFYVVELYENYIRTGNEECKNKSRETCLKIFDYFDSFKNELGLLENLEGWVFLEWSMASSKDFVEGINFPSNMMYAYALECFGKLYHEDLYVKKAMSIKETIRNLSFNGQFFIDNAIRLENREIVRTTHISETCQYYAFYTGTAQKETHPALLDTLIHHFGPFREEQKEYKEVYKSNAFIGDLLRLELLVNLGDYSRFFDECIEYYYKMVARTGTLWEHDHETCSLNHAFASYSAYLIIQSLTGFLMVDEKQKKIYCKKGMAQKDYEIRIPTKQDYVTFLSKNGTLSMKIPKGYQLVNP